MKIEQYCRIASQYNFITDIIIMIIVVDSATTGSFIVLLLLHC